ncbi:FG-GAP repeat domain-containing protein [Allostreptomyces psammosilenae]|uniref:Aldos-2-ulose dehydratase beta-propeller domain-containing protein n=1 Tax=Allostreptomyces psammosilenae TaxID=1892865 RepID=A0A852ZYJ1_9ACTN|nr:VCBS repeat-containing protein [Allostreptomyces psammosilenae]NYI06877.1 hypothetical protein [Allostreptomyces psammosilenae]
MSKYDSPKISVPVFRRELVADQLRDGYWVEAPDIDDDSKPDLFGWGLTMGEVYWYQNNGEWTRRLVADQIPMPIGGDYADISGNGLPDIVLCYDLYGPIGTIVDPKPDGGRIDWLENPGGADKVTTRWKRHYIGRMEGMHRLRVGHFTQRERLEIIGVPVVASGSGGPHKVLPIVLFTQPDDVQQAAEWPMTVIDDNSFRHAHGAERKSGLIPGSDLDSMLIASDEGVTWLYFDEARRSWEKVLIGTGELTRFEQTGFKGSGDVGIGRIGDDPFGYVAAVEPNHGNTVAVYVKESAGHPAEVTWRRHVLDVFGDPNENGEGVGHQVVAADFDGDGEEEFLVALRGPAPWQGVMYYKAIDLEQGVFAKWRISEDSAARIAIADFDGNGKLDFATIAYKVPKYFVAKDAKLLLFRNEIDLDRE